MGRGGYGSQEFWREWFAEHREPYDWLLGFEDIGGAVEALLRWQHDAKILVVGAGNSPFSSELFARGYRAITNVDNCEEVVEAQRRTFPMLAWRAADVRALPFEAESFDVVLDKGCLDNMYCYVDAPQVVERFVAEVERVLSPRGGRYVAVSGHPADFARRALARTAWRFAATDLPNPRWPAIDIELYQLLLCQKGGDHDDLDAALADATRRLSSPRRREHLPARVAHLEQRASGRRHAALILNSSSGNASASATYDDAR